MNPIALAEQDHLRRTINPHQLTNIALALLVSFALALGVLAVFNETDQNLFSVTLLLGGITLAVHFGIITRSLSMAANTVLREKHSGTWDNLILTNIGAERLVIGKWWAVVMVTWRSFALLAVLRVGVTLALGAFVLAHKRNMLIVLSDTPTNHHILNSLLAAGLIIAFTMLNCLYTAAAGVFGSLMGRVSSPGIATAEVTRIGVLVLPILLLLLPFLYLIATLGTPLPAETVGTWGVPVAWTQITLIDNGTLLAAVLANPMDSATSTLLPAALFTLILYPLLTYTLLKGGQFLARRQGVSL